MWWEHMWEVIQKKLVKPTQISSVIDVGCGWGLMLMHYIASKSLWIWF